MARISFPRKIAPAPKQKYCARPNCGGRIMLVYREWVCVSCGHYPGSKIIPDKKLARESRRSQKIAGELFYLTDEELDKIINETSDYI